MLKVRSILVCLRDSFSRRSFTDARGNTAHSSTSAFLLTSFITIGVDGPPAYSIHPLSPDVQRRHAGRSTFHTSVTQSSTACSTIQTTTL